MVCACSMLGKARELRAYLGRAYVGRAYVLQTKRKNWWRHFEYHCRLHLLSKIEEVNRTLQPL